MPTPMPTPMPNDGDSLTCASLRGAGKLCGRGGRVVRGPCVWGVGCCVLGSTYGSCLLRHCGSLRRREASIDIHTAPCGGQGSGSGQ
eukprot:7246197-Prymnesium_polylepis.1